MNPAHPTRLTAALVAALALCHTAAAAREPGRDAMIETLLPSAVIVEYSLKYDNNTPPPSTRSDTPCSGCGEYHWTSSNKYITQERPLQTTGWLVAPDTILCADLNLDDRFIDSIQVRLPNGAKTPATQSALLRRHAAMLLTTAAPPAGASPLAFHPLSGAPTKGFLASLSFINTDLTFDFKKTNLAELPLSFNPRRGLFTQRTEDALFLNPLGQPSGFTLAGASAPATLLSPPFDTLPMAGFNASEKHLQTLLGNGLHLVTLTFRSPRGKTRPEPSNDPFVLSGTSDGSTIQHALALHLAPQKLLVLRALPPKTTARLESISVLRGNTPLPATFTASLKHFGAFVIHAPGLDTQPLAVYPGDMRDLLLQPLHAALPGIPGDQLTMEHQRLRLTTFNKSWRGNIRPGPGSNRHGNRCLLFTPAAQLVTLPVPLRKDASRHAGSPAGFAASLFQQLVRELPAADIDPYNVPLSPENEHRIAWTGLDTQPLTPGLAQEYGIAHLVYPAGSRQSDRPGLIITFIHPGSPAEKAGLETGDILLRAISPDRTEPYIIKSEREYASRSFPWDNYDQMPIRYLDRLPTPWPSAENALAATLADIGFGKTVRIETISNSRPSGVDFEITASPPVYENAPQADIAALGCHVRDLTYEVRHYFRRQPQDPGVIVSRVEPGQHAALAGLRLYEIITQVNAVPVHNISEFQDAVNGKQELQFTVRRMNRERIVRIDLTQKPGATPEPGAP